MEIFSKKFDIFACYFDVSSVLLYKYEINMEIIVYENERSKYI